MTAHETYDPYLAFAFAFGSPMCLGMHLTRMESAGALNQRRRRSAARRVTRPPSRGCPHQGAWCSAPRALSVVFHAC